MAFPDGSSVKPEIMVFRPTIEQFSNFEKFVLYMESMGAHKIGVAKVIPPKEWVARESGYDNIDLVIPAPIEQQALSGCKGAFKVINVAKKSITVAEYEQLANSSRYRTPKNLGYEDLERKFWNSMSIPPPVYGADVAGTITDAKQDMWNIARLDTILSRVLKTRISGVNTPYLYFGMWKAMFAWHTEDMDLYSINYLHHGAAKAWYAIPPEHGQRFERLAKGLFPADMRECSAFLRHKMFLITPRTLRDNSIPFHRTWQEPGEFIITFPYCYHAGYNLGYNCAESTNFATERWIEYGKSCTKCECTPDMVHICMDPFVQQCQPDRYKLWMAGRDYTRHPENELSRLYPRREATRVDKQRRLQSTMLCASNVDAGKPQMSRRIPLTGSSTCVSVALAALGNSEPAIAPEPVDEVEISSVELEGTTANESVSRTMLALKRRSYQLEDDCETKLCKKSDAGFIGNVNHHSQAVDQCLQIENHQKNLIVCPQIMKQSQQNVNLCPQNANYRQQNVNRLSQNVSLYSYDDSELTNMSAEVTKAAQVYSSSPSGTCSSMVETRKNYHNHSEKNQLSSSSLLKKPPRNTTKPPRNSTKTSNSCESVAQTKRVRASQIHVADVLRTSVSRTSQLESSDLLPAVPSTVRQTSVSDDLFQVFNATFSDEILYNRQQASRAPHCAVCSVFVDKPHGALPSVSSLPISSIPCVHHDLFISRSECGVCDESMTDVSVECSSVESQLYVCSRCEVCVHAKCYGGEIISVKKWTCDRCSSGADVDRCCLCQLPGGVLKRTKDSQWAHIICVLCSESDTRFDDSLRRTVINVDCKSPSRTTCSYCHRQTMSSSCMTCVKCDADFHVTCGHIAGVTYTISYSPPTAVCAICPKHTKRSRAKSLRSCPPVTVGDKVVAKNKNGRYYHCVVASLYETLYYNVAFQDGSFSNDMFPEDIQSANGIPAAGPPPVGSSVQVKWRDGTVHKALFRGITTESTIEVQFEDGSTIRLARDKVWTLSERLPQHVALKLSAATETKYNLFQPVTTTASSRIRHAPSDYVTHFALP